MKNVTSFVTRLYSRDQTFAWAAKRSSCTGTLLNEGYIISNANCRNADRAQFANNNNVEIKFLGKHPNKSINVGVFRIKDKKYWLNNSIATFNLSPSEVNETTFTIGHSCGSNVLFVKFGEILSTQNKTYRNLQHNSMIFSHDSGSPLLDMGGKIIGLNDFNDCATSSFCANGEEFEGLMCKFFKTSSYSKFNISSSITACTSILAESLAIGVVSIIEAIKHVENITRTAIPFLLSNTSALDDLSIKKPCI